MCDIRLVQIATHAQRHPPVHGAMCAAVHLLQSGFFATAHVQRRRPIPGRTCLRERRIVAVHLLFMRIIPLLVASFSQLAQVAPEIADFSNLYLGASDTSPLRDLVLRRHCTRRFYVNETGHSAPAKATLFSCTGLRGFDIQIVQKLL